MARIAVLLEFRLCVGHVTTTIKRAILVILEALRWKVLLRIVFKITRLQIRVWTLLGSIILLACEGQLCNTAMLRTRKVARVGSLLRILLWVGLLLRISVWATTSHMVRTSAIETAIGAQRRV